MSDNEFKDLQNFGKTIEKKPEDTKKIIVKEKRNLSTQIKPIILYLKKKTLNIVIRLIKYIMATSKWTHKKIKSIEFLKHNTQKKVYKIVETKKQRRNKIIIIRKRVPFKYDPLEPYHKKANIGTIFYLSFKGDNDIETKAEAYTILKDSIWDFPTEKRRRK